MTEKDVSLMMKQFHEKQPVLSDFAERLADLIHEVLAVRSLRVHSIVSRVKESTSLLGKISKGSGKYTDLEQITDLVGIRVITYYGDEVDVAANVLKEEFTIDHEKSVDKRGLLDSDRFGYLSLHYIIEMPEHRLRLTEYKKFRGIKAEIQIRSILQHTWAEIEHDLGYKSKQPIPSDMRRSFSRLAGVLEMADIEFGSIRDKLLQESMQMTVEAAPMKTMNVESLLKFVGTNAALKEMDLTIGRVVGTNVYFSDKYIAELMPLIRSAGMESLTEIEAALAGMRGVLHPFLERWYNKQQTENVSAGTALLFLCILHVVSEGTYDDLKHFLLEHRICRSHDINPVSKAIVQLYKELVLNH
ncbi:GTP pyrophosphokinase [Candidatus Pristimantibacillus sp. PTI5]|uniref:GTP pyrophosphokinase n=1 Tax=Candidatus Pristimantibacillus sp. PTI5 TaxID=3400422 RepID=UPI003B02E8E3